MRSSLRYFALFGLLACTASLYGSSGGVDETFSTAQYITVCLMFLAWSIGLLGWAILLRKLLKLDSFGWPAAMVLSLILHSMVIATLGTLGGIGPSSNLYFLASVFLGQTFAFTLGDFKTEFFQFKNFYQTPRQKKLSWIIIAVIFITILDRLLRTQIPWGYTDPLFYQLLAPRYWAESGSIYYPSNAPLTMMASYWEYLHVWAFKLLSSAPGKGLIEVQLFAQLTHLMAYVACGFTVERFCRAKFKLKPETTLLATLSVLSIQPLIFTACLAKNDWGTALIILVGVELLDLTGEDSKLFEKDQTKRNLLAGFFLGIGAGAKYIHTPFVFAIILVKLVCSYRAQKKVVYRQHLILGLSVCLGLIPFIGRNVFFTGNPLFPFYNHFFPAKVSMSPGLLQTNKFYEDSGDGRSLYNIVTALWNLFSSDFSLFLAPFVAFFGLIYAKKKPLPFYILAASLFAVLIFAIVGAKVPPRHAGVPLMIFGVTTPLSIEYLGERIKNQRILLIANLLLLMGVLGFSGTLFRQGFENERSLSQFIAYLIHDETPNIHIVKYHFGGIIKAWLRDHAPLNTKILMTGEETFYYLPKLNIVSAGTSADILPALSGASNSEQFFHNLRSQGFKYLGDNSYVDGNSSLSKLFSPFVTEHPCLVAYQTKDARVIDLEVMEKLVNGQCPN